MSLDLYLEGFTPPDLPRCLPALTDLSLKTGAWSGFGWTTHNFDGLDYPQLERIIVDDHQSNNQQRTVSFEFLRWLGAHFLGKTGSCTTITVLHAGRTDGPGVTYGWGDGVWHPIRKVFNVDGGHTNFRQINGLWTLQERDVFAAHSGFQVARAREGVNLHF